MSGPNQVQLTLKRSCKRKFLEPNYSDEPGSVTGTNSSPGPDLSEEEEEVVVMKRRRRARRIMSSSSSHSSSSALSQHLIAEFERTSDFLKPGDQEIYQQLMQKPVVADASVKTRLDNLLRKTGARGPGGANSVSHMPIGVPLKTTLVDNYAAPFKQGRDQNSELHYDPYTDSGQVVAAAYADVQFASFDADPVRGDFDEKGYPKARNHRSILASLKNLGERLAVLNTPQVICGLCRSLPLPTLICSHSHVCDRVGCRSHSPARLGEPGTSSRGSGVTTSAWLICAMAASSPSTRHPRNGTPWYPSRCPRASLSSRLEAPRPLRETLSMPGPWTQ